MAPPHNIVEDYYGNKEYIGPDPYGHFHKSTTTPVTSNTKFSSTSTYNTRYNYSHNPDYSITDRAVESKPIDGKPVYKSVSTFYDRDELHFWSTGQGFTGSKPVVYYFEPKQAIFELNADCYEGTISTDVDSVTWARRTQSYIEVIRDYSIYVDNLPKEGILSKISLCVKTANNNVTFLYLKCNEIGKRKILWTIWERNRSKYDSYKQFKQSWDSKSGIWSSIKEDIREDIRDEVKDLLGIRKIKKDLRKSVRAEVEKLLRDTRPFDK